MDESTHHKLSERLAVLEERMNTKSAERESALDRLRADMASWKTDMADWKTDMAQREIEAGKRENRMLCAVFAATGLIVAVLGVGIAILSFLLT